MTIFMRIVLVAVLFVVPCVAAPVVALPDGGVIIGTPGDLIGWGVIVTNDTPYYLVVSSVVLAPVSDALPGLFVETLPVWFALNFPASIAPGGTLVQGWVPGSRGLGDVTLDAGAAAGSTFHLAVVGYDLYEEVDLVTWAGSDTALFEGAEVRVLADEGTPGVPEPSTLLLAGIGLVGIGWRLGRRERGLAGT